MAGAAGQHGGVEAELRRRLPNYMVPAAIVPMAGFPLSPNGKLDRKSLPLPDSNIRPSNDRDRPTTSTEIALSHLWSEIIGVDDVSASDDFFELGGHSLLATRLAARIASELGVAVPLGTLFEEPVLRRYATAIDQLAASADAPVELPVVQRVDRDAYAPGSLVALFGDDAFEPVERVARAAAPSRR